VVWIRVEVWGGVWSLGLDVRGMEWSEWLMVDHEVLARVGCFLIYVCVKVWTWRDVWQCC
jgi:hypothetical protein